VWGARPNILFGSSRGKVDRLGQRLWLGDGMSGTVSRIERGQGARDPGGARRAEAFDQLTPCEFFRLIVVAGAPGLFPEMFAPDQLLIDQSRLVCVHVNFVGIDANTQLRAAVRWRKEKRFEANREQNNRMASGRRERGGGERSE